MHVSTCSLPVERTLPLVCIGCLFSFLCGVGIGANDLSANFAMVVGSGSLDMRKAIIYCTVFELLGAAFLGGHVSNTIRKGIVDPAVLRGNRDIVIVGMTCASFATALWLYLSAVFGFPVSITHTVVGSMLGFAVFATMSFTYVNLRGIIVIVVSWVAAPVAACLVTALLFYYMRRYIFLVPGRSFELSLTVLPVCLAASLMVDFFFVLIERPPIMTQTVARVMPVSAQLVILLGLILLFCWFAVHWIFPRVAEAAWEASSFVWEVHALRTETDADMQDDDVSLAITTSATTEPDSREGKRALEDDALLTAESTHRSLCHGRRECGRAMVVVSSLRPFDSRLAPPKPVRLAPVTGPSGNTRGRTDSLQFRSHSSPPQRPRGGGNASHLVKPCLTNQSFSPGVRVEGHMDHRETVGGVAGYGTMSTPSPSEENWAESTASFSAAHSPSSVDSRDVFGDEDWVMDHPMQPIRFGGMLLKPFNPRAEYLFTGLQVVAGSMSSLVHGAVAGANATAAFTVLYEAFTDHELGESELSSSWAIIPAMLGIAIGMFALGASLMKTVGVELVTVTPFRGWCIQMGGTSVTMLLTGMGIPVSLSQSQVGAAVGCGVLDAKWKGVSWGLVGKIAGGWIVTLVISALTTGCAMWMMQLLLC